MKKKILLGLVGAVLLGLSAPAIVQAQDYSIEQRQEKSYTVVVTYRAYVTMSDGKTKRYVRRTKSYTVRAYTASDAEAKAERLFKAESKAEFISANAS